MLNVGDCFRSAGGPLVMALLLGFPADGGAAGWKHERLLGEVGFQHGGMVDEIVPLPDGKHVLTSSRDGAARLWDLASGKLLRRFEGEDGGDVWGVLPLPGGKELLTAAEPGVVPRWNLATGEEIMTYKHGSTAFRLALHPDGDRFVATDSGKLAIMWDLETGKELCRFSGHESSVYTAAIVAGGKRVVTGGGDGKMKVWDAVSGDCERTLKVDFEDLYTIALSPDRARFATASEDSVIRVYEADEVRLVLEIELPDECKVVAWSPDGAMLATGCEDGNLYVLDAKEGEVLQKIEVPGYDHTGVAFSADGKELLSGGDRLLYRWDWVQGQRITPGMGVPVHGQGGTEVAVVADGTVVLSSDGKDQVIAWEAATGTIIRAHTFPASVTALAASPRGDGFAVGTAGRKVYLRKARSGAGAFTLTGPRIRGGISGLAFNKKGDRLAAGSGDEIVYVWEIPGGRVVSELEGHEDDVADVAISPANGAVLTVSDDNTVRLWDGASGKEIRAMEFGRDDPRMATFFADGRGIIVSSGNAEVRGWIPEARAIVEVLAADEVAAARKDLAHNTFAVRKAAIEKLVAQGAQILPLLGDEGEDDPEVIYRLREIREKIRRAELGSGLDTLHTFASNVRALASNPHSGEWAAVVGTGVSGQIIVGTTEDKALKITDELRNGRGPGGIAFSLDGSTLVSSNSDGTLSVYRK